MALFFQENKANHDSKELRLEDREIMADPAIEKFIHNRNPRYFGKTLTRLETEQWCRRFMAGQVAETQVQKCSPQ
jgi:hypothetical protein